MAQRPLLPKEIDAELVPPAWKKAVYSNTALPEGAVVSDAFVVCVLGQLHRELTRRDVFASPSNRVTINRRLRIVSAPSYDPA